MILRKKFKRVVPDEVNVDDLTAMDVTCGTTKCNEGFHCYSQKKTSFRKFGEDRVCKECGADLIDWERVHKNDLEDSDFVFQELQTEIIRHVFWHTPIESEAIIKSLIHGKEKTKIRAKKIIRSRIGKLTVWDGRQTPMGQNELINYAQHATATCCRKCLEAWHDIKLETQLNDEQVEFCADLIMKYIEKRVPHIEKEGISEEAALNIVDNEYN